MAEKAKAKKAKPLAKKTAAARPKKKEISVKDAYHEADVEELQLAQEELPKRGSKTSKAAAEKKAQHAHDKAETRSTTPDEKPAKIAHAAPQIIAPRVAIEKPAHEPKVDKPKHETPRHETKHHSGAQAQSDGLRIRLSESLVKKLKDQAADEGISLEEFVAELLAESVVLRAWEIVERKNAMKGPSQGQGPMGGGNRNYNNQGQGNKGNNNNQRGGGNQGGGNKGHRGMNHARYQSIMDDKATFLEYVRNQEKNRR